VYKADIKCQHLVTAAIHTFHMSDLKICFATYEEAYNAALVDYEQYVVDSILRYKGDPERRTSMTFLVKFADNSESWLPYSRNISETIQFEQFCRANKPLLPLVYTLEAWKRILSETFPKVTGVQPGDICYVDLRAWGFDFFVSIGLPEEDKSYVLKCKYGRWRGKSKKSIEIWCFLFKEYYFWDAFSVYAYGSDKLLTDQMILVDEDMVVRYPAIVV
jgi:hypothetical protein